MTITTLLADFLVVIHLVYMAVVLFGQLGIMVGHHLGWRWVRNPWFRIIHFTMIIVVAYEAVERIECPLTTWERDLRIEAGQIPANYRDDPNWSVDNASFVARLARGVLLCPVSWEPILYASYYFFAGLVVATLILVPPRFRRLAVTTAPAAGARETTIKAKSSN
ncbi:MAG: DUF2784 family protein [Gemmataceae bacterium]|nr:DUF2784 family protein [Gemmataceae bacterium]